jgi:hypothetical protein
MKELNIFGVNVILYSHTMSVTKRQHSGMEIYTDNWSMWVYLIGYKLRVFFG